jgi:hypothetical protein
MKITQFGHGICSASGSACDCCLGADHPYAIAQEKQANDSDSGRFLAAGARRSYWVRTAMGQIENALPSVRKVRESSRNLIVESNSIVEYLKPDLFLMVMDFAQADFKSSSRRLLDRADACIVIHGGSLAPPWSDLAGAWESKPQFTAEPPQYVTAALAAFVAASGTSGNSSA